MNEMMGMSLDYTLLLLLGALIIAVVTVQAQDQSGFISLDCGLLPENSSYTEQNTGINYISDSKFIKSGVSKSVIPGEKSTHQQQLSFLRSFPNGVRNCYRINVTIGTKYFIRATFLYGNYDGLNVLPQFDLHLGPNLWDTVKFTSSSLSTNNEIIHVPSKNYINLCLVNTGNGTPFISAIELRILKNDTYDIAESSAGSLARVLRLDLGSYTNSTYRFKDDIYDRFWSPTVDNPRWTQISTTLTNDQLAQNDYSPPAIVMSTALKPTNSSASFDLYWDSNSPNEKYYLYMHFAEVQKLASNETRSFNISLNGKFWYGPLVPSYQSTTTVFSPSALTGEKRYLFSLFKTESSTLPPIINAIETYIVKEFSQLGTEQDDVDAITNIKNAYKLDRNWQGDPCAPVSYMWEGLNCSFESNNPPRIISLILSSSGLTGQIPTYISKLSMLQYLDLSNNSLSGAVPDFLTQLQSLEVLNLENNNFTGYVPSGLMDRSKKGSLSLSVGQNPNLCESATSCNQQTSDTNKKKKSNVVIPVVASIAGVLVLLLIVAAAIIFGLKKRKPQEAMNNHVEHNINPSGSELETKQRQYSFNELVKITNNFDRIIGRGGFGKVYHGFIDETQVAVKMLSASSVQGYQQFLAEVKLLMRVHHRNLTSLIGYCNEENSIGLIYEYMENGNLDEHLSGKIGKAKFLTWEDRLQIAVDSAQGLEYLHNGCKPQIIHRDVKCANILLNANFKAKLADFGLSKSFPNDGTTHVSTVVAGTPGYLDPEYSISNRLTEKSDVYSFGVVLLEIITGQPAITRTHEKLHISQFVSSMLSKGDIKSIIDSRLQGDYDTNSVWKAVEIAMASVSISSSKRPYMSDVVSELKDCLAKELARRQYSVSSENKDSIELITSNMASEIQPFAR